MPRTHSPFTLHRLLTRVAHGAVASAFVLAPLACGGAVPEVKSDQEPVLPPGPQREAQALSSPTSENAESGANADAFCLDGSLTEQTYNEETGEFSSLWTCDAGGGIATIANVGQTDPNTGDGGYDQITTFEDGSASTWHFTIDVSDDFLVQAYHGESEGGLESYDGTYTFRDDGDWDVDDIWRMHEGTYTIVGVQSADGEEFDGHETFDDPHTDVDPDWELDYVQNADGTFSQTVHTNGDGFVSDYDYVQNADGSSVYNFVTDMLATDAAPDFEGSYAYNADFSGAGDYVQNFEDGSLLNVHDVIAADGSVLESWTFDDAGTALDVDQEGEIAYAADGSGEGTFTLHSEGGESETCEIHLSADGTQTIDHCE
jgi:hypothetical protein